MNECPQCGYEPKHTESWGEPKVHIIGFWPVEERGLQGYDNHFISRCRYRTACAQAHYSLQIIERPEQAELPVGLPVISMEEPDYTRGVIELQDFKHPEEAVYILGNSKLAFPSGFFDVDYKVGIKYNDTDIAAYSPFYGDQIVSIIWYDRLLKNE